MAEIAELGFVVDATGIERGVRKGNSALDALERKIQRVSKVAADANKTLSQGIGISGGANRQGAAAASVEREISRAVDTGVRQAKSGGARIGAALSASLAGAFAVTGLTAGLAAVATASLNAAKELDKSRQTIAALTGSVESANVKLAELKALAQSSPGITTGFAAQLFAQFKAIGGIGDSTINSLIRSIGKLNAAFTLPDVAQFGRNLTQIFQQGFERADIKEALGQVPIFEQILEQAFGTKDGDKLRKLKAAGALTLGTFLGGFADAVASDKRFASIQESLGTRIDKLRESILSSLAPLGDEIGRAIAAGLTRLNDELRDSSTALRDFAGQVKGLVSDMVGAFSQLTGGRVLFDLREELRDLEGLVAAVRDVVNLGSTRHLVDFRNRRENQRQLSIPAAPQFLSPDSISQLDIFFGQGGAGRTGDRFGSGVPGRTSRSRGSGGGGGRGNAESQARQLRQAQLQFRREQIEQEARLEKDALDRQLKGLEQFYEQGKIGTREYYDARAAIAEKSIGVELKLLEDQRKTIEASQAKKGSAEQIRLDQELLRINTDIVLKLRERNQALIDGLAEYKKKLGELPTGLDLSRQETVRGEFITPTQQRARNTLTVLTKEADQYRRIQADLQADEIRVQNDIQAGILSEVEGRRLLLAVQREYRGELISALVAERELADLKGNSVRVSQINAEIESLRNLGLELNNTQRFLQGLGSATDPGQLFEGLGSGLRNAIRTGFRDGFGAAKRSFTDLLKDLAAELLTSTLVQTIRNLFNPRAQGGGASGFAGGIGATGGGGGLGGILNGLLGGGGGGGNFLTGGFAGGNPASAALGGGSGGGGGILGGLLNRFLGGGGLNPSQLRTAGIGPGGIPILSGAGKGGALGGLNLGGLGASGLLLGGGLLGSLAGGKSGIGKLLGGLGGTLGAGAIGASGLLGGGIAGALPALFSNPITAIIGGALIGGALLFKFFSNRDLKDYRKHILNEYALDVKSDKVLEQVREIGKQNFGKDYKNKRIETVRLSDVRELLVAYAERTGQKGNSKLISASGLQDPFNEQNRFIRRAFGGPVSAFQPTVVGDGGRPEVFMPQSPGLIFPSVGSFASAMRGGENNRAMIGILVRVAEALDRFESMPPGEVVRTALSSSPDIATEAVAQSFRRRTDASGSIRDNVFQR